MICLTCVYGRQYLSKICICEGVGDCDSDITKRPIRPSYVGDKDQSKTERSRYRHMVVFAFVVSLKTFSMFTSNSHGRLRNIPYIQETIVRDIENDYA